MISSSIFCIILLVAPSTVGAFLHDAGRAYRSPFQRNYGPHTYRSNPSFSTYSKKSRLSALDLEIAPIIATPRSYLIPPSEIVRGAMVLVSVTLLSGYHIRLFKAERAGNPSWRSSQAQTRQDWSKFVRKTEGWLYAVQTLRNAITANTFLATTVLSLLTLISGKLWEMIRSLSGNSYLQYAGVGKSKNLLVIQFASVAMSMLSSAYEFLQSARLMTHAGFMFPVAKGNKVDMIMRKSENAQWRGLRWLYISLGVICWIVSGEGGLLVSSLASLQFFRKIDRVPKGAEQDESAVN